VATPQERGGRGERDMPSQYRKESRSDPYDASMQNLLKARASERWHPPRPWRSKEEGCMVRRYVLWWFNCRDRSRPSGRSWAKQLGISHTWLQNLVREFRKDPSKMRRLQAYGDPTLAQLSRAKEYTRQMRERGQLRLHDKRTQRGVVG
jgi:hypothetical protein